MQAALFASLLVLTATVAAKQPPGEHEMFYPDREAEKTCEELCMEDKGLDAETCATECAVGTDLSTHHMDEGVENVVEDEAYNEAGGEAMEEKAEADHPVDILDCAPEVDIDHAPDLTELDTNQDGVVEEEEAEAYGKKACVPDEMTDQIFNQADTNCDHVISADEYESSGEDTAQEEAVDKALEETSEGDDEYNSVQAPPLEEFDENKDGGLDPDEHHEAVEFEMERRGEGRWSVDDSEVPEEQKDEAFDKVDTDDDGLIEGDEYTEPAEGEGSDMGEEINEAAAADDDATDPDDLPAAGSPAPAAAASMLSTRVKVAQRNEALSTRFKNAQRNEAAFLKRFNIPERKHSVAPKKRTKRSFGHFGRAFVELARKHHALRQKHQALRRKHQVLRQRNLRSHRRTALHRHHAM